jgi:hypothetical protein
MHKTEEEIIEDEAVEQAMRIWGGPRAAREELGLQLPYTHCTRCPRDEIKQPCICNVVDGTALCCRHWIEERIRLLTEKRTKVVAKLDLKDFCKI